MTHDSHPDWRRQNRHTWRRRQIHLADDAVTDLGRWLLLALVAGALIGAVAIALHIGGLT